MAKKKVARKPAVKAVKKALPRGKPAAAKRAATKAVVKKAAVKKPVVTKAGSPKAAARPAVKKGEPVTPKRVPGESLGRPLLTAEEKLYMLFKEDYHARQIFEFLRVETLGDLEKYSPQQIIQILSTPLRKTVERIRERLADNKRHLREDLDFAREHLASREAAPK